jgi:hypothetical protein
VDTHYNKFFYQIYEKLKEISGRTYVTDGDFCNTFYEKKDKIIKYLIWQGWTAEEMMEQTWATFKNKIRYGPADMIKNGG